MSYFDESFGDLLDGTLQDSINKLAAAIGTITLILVKQGIVQQQELDEIYAGMEHDIDEHLTNLKGNANGNGQ